MYSSWILIHKGRWRQGSGLPFGLGLWAVCLNAPAILDRLLDRIVIPTPTAGLWVIPSDTSIDAQAFYKKPPTTIRRALHALEQPFDFIVLDTPPNLDRSIYNSL